MSLTDRLANLQVLLQSKSFSRWPLQVHFFAEDVFLVWTRWIERNRLELRAGIPIKGPSSEATVFARKLFEVSRYSESKTKVCLRKLFKQYADIIKEKEKEDVQLSSRKEDNCAYCSVCSNYVDKSSHTMLACPNTQCGAVSHLQCLASKFLDEEHSENLIIPVMGNCPFCGARVRWIELIMDLSNRIHGSKNLRKIKNKNAQAGSKRVYHNHTTKINSYSNADSVEHLSEG